MNLAPEGFFDVYDEGLNSSLARVADATGKAAGTLIRDAAPTLARYLAEATQPVAGLTASGGSPDGGSALARNMGQAAVRRDVSRVYASPSGVFEELKRFVNSSGSPVLARAFYKAMKEGDFEDARRLCQDAGISAGNMNFVAWDGGAAHRRARNKRGRVNRGTKPVVVSDAKGLKEYTRKKEKLVGFAKSGFITAGEQVNGKRGRVQAWIRNQRGPGRGVDRTKDTTTPSISLTNEVRYASDVLQGRYETGAVEAFTRSFTQMLTRTLEHHARKEEQRANAAQWRRLSLAA